MMMVVVMMIVKRWRNGDMEREGNGEFQTGKNERKR